MQTLLIISDDGSWYTPSRFSWLSAGCGARRAGNTETEVHGDTPLALKCGGFLGYPHQRGGWRPTALSEPENIPSGVLIAICDVTARTTKYPLGEREMQHKLST